MKFSIIIPVYNVEKYIKRCLESINNQTYNNYEVIIVNDGTKDKSMDIINAFVKDKKSFKVYTKENGGLSSARNYGLKYVDGDYIIFLDSDDYWNNQLLETLNNNLEKQPVDVIKFGLDLVEEDGKLIRHTKGNSFSNKSSLEAFSIIISEEFSEPAWSYAYKSSFFLSNGFVYQVGTLHEDFGLTPLVLIKAENITEIPLIGYYYVQRENSIMSTVTHEKTMKKISDTLLHYDRLFSLVKNDTTLSSDHKKIFNSYIANAIISKGQILESKELDEYIIELKKRHVYNYLLVNTVGRLFKKIVIKINLKWYIKRLKKS